MDLKKQQKKKNPNRFTYFIIGTIAFSQGIMGLSDLAIQFMQKDDYHQKPAETAFISGIITIPWVIKPLWGILTDTVPLCGYRRKSYLMLFGCLGFVLWNLLAHFGIQNQNIGLSLLLGINVCIAFCNVIGEALLVELSGHTQDDEEEETNTGDKPQQIKQDSASSNVSFFFGMRSFGTLLTAYFSGELLDLVDKKYIFMITSVFPLLLAFISLFLVEKNQNSQKTKQNQLSTTESLGEFVEFIAQPAIYKPIMLILTFMAAPSASTAMFYFYTNVLHFKPEFIGELRLMYAISSIFAVFLFNQFLKNVRFTKVFACSTIFYCCVSCLTIVLVTRENVKLGIPDKVFCMGDGVLDQVVGELNTMPLLVLACKMCPKNIEGTMYALLMSTINLGGLLSGQIGAVITYYMGVTEIDFTNLPYVILITSLSALLPLPFIGIIKESDLMKAKEKKIPITQGKNAQGQPKTIEADPDTQSLLNNELTEQLGGSAPES